MDITFTLLFCGGHFLHKKHFQESAIGNASVLVLSLLKNVAGSLPQSTTDLPALKPFLLRLQ